MVLQVYTGHKPALPHRAMIGSILLMGSVCILAATLTNRRSASLLDEPLRPPNWSIAFQPPRSFRDMERGLTELGPTYRFSGKARNGSDAILFAYQISPRPHSDAGDICRTVLTAWFWQDKQLQQRPTPEATEEFLGGLGAMQISDPSRGVIVRAAIVSTGEAYAIALQVQPQMLDSWAINLFNKVCDSVQTRAD